MVGSQSKSGPLLSWADEVEKEEEAAEAAAAAAAAQAELQRKQKPNPFGSARPREVVLQEKGIDWKESHLQQPSPIPIRHESQNERLRKESNPPSAAIILNRIQTLNCPIRGLRQELLEDKQKQALRGRPVWQTIATPQDQIPAIPVPPLRYPPKYVGGRLYQPAVYDSLSGYQFEHDKENRFHEQQLFDVQSMSAMCGKGRAESELGQAKEAQNEGRCFKKSAAQGNQVAAPDPTPVNGRIRPLEMYKRKPSGNDRGLKNIKDSQGREGPQGKGFSKSLIKENSDKKSWSHDLGINKTVFQVTDNNKVEDEARKMAGKFKDLSSEQIGKEGKARSLQIINPGRALSGRNNKKKQTI